MSQATEAGRSGDAPRHSPVSELAWIALFVGITLILTAPLITTLDQASSLRGDYFNNLWNAWWLRTALLEQHASPWWTDFLHWPNGISLARHTLSPLNALWGAVLAPAVGPLAALNLLVLFHFALAGWGAFLLARDATGSTSSAVIAGIVYSFCPFHYYYLAQINAFSTGLLPLVVLAMLRVYRRGGVAGTLGVVAGAAALAATSSYYLVYAALVGGLVLAAGRWVDPRVEAVGGMRRLGVAGALAMLAVVIVAWPLVSAGWAEVTTGASTGSAGAQEWRTNDLLGFNWLGLPERVIVSWPTMVGYGVVALFVAGRRTVLAQRFWLLVAAVFGLLGLGTELSVSGYATGIPLPYAVLERLPVLSMLRKADRAHAVVQLAVAVLVAFAWRDVARRISSLRLRRLASAAVAAALALELAAVPFGHFELPRSPILAGLRERGDVETLVHLPAAPGSYVEGRYNLAQTAHGKKMPQGYTTSLALDEAHLEEARIWREASGSLARGDATAVSRLVRSRGIDLVVLHRTVPRPRPPLFADDGRSVWAPFFFVRRALLRSRQLGSLVDRPVPAAVAARQEQALTRELGPPILEDELVAVFEPREP